MSAASRMWTFLGVAGTVLFLFGLASYGITTEFDLWTAVHLTGGACLMATAAVLNFASLRGSLASSGTRRKIGGAAGAVVFLAVLVVVNVLASRAGWRMDLTENRIHTLSEWSRSAVAEPASPILVQIFYDVDDPGLLEAERLMERYAAAGGAGFVWEWVDPELRPDVAMRHDVTRSGTVVVSSGETVTRRVVDPAAGIDETVITPMLLRVSDPDRRFVYFVAGPGQLDPFDLDDPRGLGGLARELDAENFGVATLEAEGEVPGSASVLVVAGERAGLSGSGVERLERFLAGGGSLLLMADPGEGAAFDSLLEARQIRLGDDMVVDPSQVRFRGARLGLDPLVSDFPDHPATRGFEGPVVLPRARSVEAAGDGDILARSGEASWAERDWRGMLETGRAGRGEEDPPGPVTVAAAWEDGESGSRIVVIGDADLATNAGLYAYGNREFLIRTVRWLAGAEERLDVEPRRLRASRIEIGVADFRTLFRLGVLLVPEAILIVGLGVWWWRRGL